MIRTIVKTEFALSRPSDSATTEDAAVGQDLLDTLAAHGHECVGMAANMIGVRKRIIVFTDGNHNRLMFNPEITKQFQPYETVEGCLSLQGQRPTKRYRKITVRFQDHSFTWRKETFSGFTAQIIQHEIDHCNGIVI